ncbi:MAG: spore germination protein [Firmicutes bacterium]|nr:spore germination protein [Bacillota bacterium]
MQFLKNFDRNIQLYRDMFARDDTFKIKQVFNHHLPELRIAVLLSGAMVSSDVVDRDVLMPLSNLSFDPTPKGVLNGGITNHTVELTTDFQKSVVQIGAGDCVVLIDDFPCCIIIDAKGMPRRGNDAPETEISLLGPQDGFNENIMGNIGLLKKRIASSKLKCEFTTLGKQSNNKVAVCYLEGIVRSKLVYELKKRLGRVNIDFVPDGNVLAELMRDAPYSVFKTVGKTSRPDVLAAKLMEGRIGLIIDGSPVALTLPYIFAEAFQSPDDYYQSFLYANVGRFLRYSGFLISILLPGFYLAIVNFNPGVLPAHWLYTVLASSEGVPIKTVTEMLFLFFAFEILRETGSRMPAGLGLALNIVGAVILGDAAVTSNIVSTPMVIIVAFSGVTGLMVKDLKGAVFYLRLLLIVLGALFGLPGLAAGVIGVLLHLSSLNSMDVPYLYTMGKATGKQDTLIRAPYWQMIRRQRKFTTNERRQG